MQFTLYRVTVFENRSAINQQAQITTASSTSARLGGQRESRASETNNYKHVIEIQMKLYPVLRCGQI